MRVLVAAACVATCVLSAAAQDRSIRSGASSLQRAPRHPQATGCAGKRIGIDSVRLTGALSDLNCALSTAEVFWDSLVCNRCRIRVLGPGKARIRGSVLFRGGELLGLELNEGTIERLVLDGTRIGTLAAHRIHVQSLRIYGASVQRLDLRDSAIDTLVLDSVSLGSALLDGLITQSLRVRSLGSGLLQLDGGRIAGLAVSGSTNDSARIALRGVTMVEPYFDLDLLKHIDFSQAGPFDADFVLQQSVSASRLRGGSDSPQRKKFLLDAQLAYRVIAQQLRVAGDVQGARILEIREREAALEATSGRAWRWCLRFWHVHLRGDFGLSPSHVALHALHACLAFAFLYLVMGIFGFAWAAQVPQDLQGSVRGDPRVLHFTPGRDMATYALNAIAFSVDRIALGSTRVLQVEQLFGGMSAQPARFVGVGLGRVVGAIETSLGVVMAISLIEGIARSL